MTRKTPSWRLVLLLLTLIALAGCLGGRRESVEDIRAAAQSQSSVVDVLPLADDEVAAWLAEARQLESEGRIQSAKRVLDKALKDRAGEPRLLQLRAELNLLLRRYLPAIADATRSYNAGPKIGELCARSWRTTAAARRARGDEPGAEAAMERAAGCSLTPPPRL